MTFNTQHCSNFYTGDFDYQLMADTINKCMADIVGLNEMRGKGNDENPISQEQFDEYIKVKKKPGAKAKKQFNVAYEDDRILIAEKPFGLLTHGDAKEKKNHLAKYQGKYQRQLE